MKTIRMHLNTQKKISQAKIKKCSKEFKLEPILKATSIPKLIEKLEKAKNVIIQKNICKLKIKCKPDKIRPIVNNDLENDD